MLDFGTVFLIFIVLILMKLFMTGRRPKGMPPGPATWPFLGNLNLICWDKKYHLKMKELGDKYNGMFSLQYGAYPGIMITNYKIAKEAFVDQADIFADRLDHTDFQKMLDPLSDAGLGSQNGGTWMQLRKLTITALRDFGVGKAAIESKLHVETSDMVSYINQRKNTFFSLEPLFDFAVSNSINLVLFDKRYEYDNREFIKEIDYSKRLFEGTGSIMLLRFMPWWLLPILFLQPKMKQILQHKAFVKNWITNIIREHRKTFDKEHLRDFVDLYIELQTAGKRKQYTDKMLFNTIVHLFGAGTGTNVALLWIMFYFVKFPDVQDKCRQEIQQKVGNRRITNKDRGNLPYFEAAISEGMRIISGQSFLHKTTKTTTLAGFTIPKNTIVSFFAISQDETMFPDPLVFKPERFLNADGQYVKPEGYILFGLGKRICPGEMMAKEAMFIFLGELLRHFSFEAENPFSLRTPEKTDYNFAMTPEDFRVKATKITTC